MKETKAQKIKRKIDELYTKLHKHQEKCSHLNVNTKDGYSRGNVCESDDMSWTDYKCNICLKTWTIKH